MEQIKDIEKAYSYVKHRFGTEFLKSGLGLHIKTIQHYDKGDFPTTLNRQAKILIMTYEVSNELSPFTTITLEREFETEIKVGESLRDLILRFSHTKDLSVALEYVHDLVQRRIGNLKKVSPIERFREKYGNYNERNLAKAGQANDFDLLRQIVLSSSIDARPKGYALVTIAEYDQEKRHEDFVRQYFLNDSPFLREASIKAAHQYLDDEDENAVETFKKDLSQIAEKSRMFSGVIKTIENIIETL